MKTIGNILLNIENSCTGTNISISVSPDSSMGKLYSDARIEGNEELKWNNLQCPNNNETILTMIRHIICKQSNELLRQLEEKEKRLIQEESLIQDNICKEMLSEQANNANQITLNNLEALKQFSLQEIKDKLTLVHKKAFQDIQKLQNQNKFEFTIVQISSGIIGFYNNYAPIAIAAMSFVDTAWGYIQVVLKIIRYFTG